MVVKLVMSVFRAFVCKGNKHANLKKESVMDFLEEDAIIC